MFELPAFTPPTNLGQPMHSQSALTEHVSLNLARFFCSTLYYGGHYIVTDSDFLMAQGQTLLQPFSQKYMNTLRHSNTHLVDIQDISMLDIQALEEAALGEAVGRVVGEAEAGEREAEVWVGRDT